MALIIEGFVVEKLIKKGGFAEVYRVKRVLDRKILAIKILRPDTNNRKNKGLLYKEAKLLAQFDHPTIIKGFGIVHFAPRAAILMEYFEHNTLQSLIVNKSPLLEEKGIKIFRAVAEALKYLHEKQKIIQKDVKPENILVNEEAEVRLVDYNISEKLDFWSYLRDRKRQGTILYMSPEQLRKEKLDFRTDIYSLGATFYLAFGGRHHIKADSEKALIQQQLRGVVAKLRTFNKKVPYQIDNIIMRMLKKRREDRYQSMAEILFELNRFTTEDYLVKPSSQDTKK